jgi:hypothetical protein
MEHREPPGTIVEDRARRSAAETVPRQLEAPRPEPTGPGRPEIGRTRAAIAVSIVIGALVGLYLVYRAVNASQDWLAEQPAFQLDFTAIELDPPPPTWYRGRTARFLEEVRRLSGMPERIPVLKLRKAELAHVFEHSPWTEDVLKVAYPPLGVTVQLAYRRPVALVYVSPSERYLIDASAVIVPKEDVDRDLDGFVKQQPLITIMGAGLAAPRNPRPGLEWKPAAGASELAQGNVQIPAAARLAGFLTTKLQTIDRDRNHALNFLYINPMDDDRPYRGLFLWNPDEKVYVLWGNDPVEEDPAGANAEEKWRKICAWSRTMKRRSLQDGYYWEIVGTGLVARGGPRPPASARGTRPPRDVRAILTKDPGQPR